MTLSRLQVQWWTPAGNPQQAPRNGGKPPPATLSWSLGSSRHLLQRPPLGHRAWRRTTAGDPHQALGHSSGPPLATPRLAHWHSGGPPSVPLSGPRDGVADHRQLLLVGPRAWQQNPSSNPPQAPGCGGRLPPVTPVGPWARWWAWFPSLEILRIGLYEILCNMV